MRAAFRVLARELKPAWPARARRFFCGSARDTICKPVILSLSKDQTRPQRSSKFCLRYNLDRLVFYEDYPTAREAIAREKQLKGWRREKKIALIEAMNPIWNDLSGRLRD
jgi:hypothetical protein